MKRLIEYMGDALALSCICFLIWIVFVIGHGMGF